MAQDQNETPNCADQDRQFRTATNRQQHQHTEYDQQGGQFAAAKLAH